MSTRVVHVSDGIEGAIYIGRANGRKKLKASMFANPFVIGKPHPWPERGALTRGDVMFFYADYFWHRPDLIRGVIALRGKVLACWCRHDGVTMVPEGDGDNRCHGDYLAWVLDHWTDGDLLAKARQAEKSEGAQS